MTTIVNYGAGNLALRAEYVRGASAPYEVVTDPASIQAAKKIVLPGVGHFGQMMRSLDDLGLRDVLIEKIRNGTPLLGICVGLQCLFEGSEESPERRVLLFCPDMSSALAGPCACLTWDGIRSTEYDPRH